MSKHYRRKIDFIDVFASTQTTQSDPDQPPHWIDETAEKAFNDFMAASREIELPDDSTIESTGENVATREAIWKDVTSKGRKKKGQRLYGFGEHGEATLFPSTHSVVTSLPPPEPEVSLAVAVLQTQLQETRERMTELTAQNERMAATLERILLLQTRRVGSPPDVPPDV